MSNEDLPQSAEMASAYLDGELDGPDRATAAADPEVGAAVDSFMRVRGALADVSPVDPSVKNAAIAATLAEFDATRSSSTSVIVPMATPATTTAAATPVVSLSWRRHRMYRVVTGAAAAAIIAVVAVAALNAGGDSDDDFAVSSATEAPAFVGADTAPELKAVAADAGGTTESASEETAAAAASAAGADSTATVPVIDSPEALTDYAASLEVLATTAAPAATIAPADSSADAAPSVQAAPPAGYAATACLDSDKVVIGPIIYQGTPALAVRDSVTGSLQAVDDSDCRVLDEVPAP